MPKIILVKGNGQRICIKCNRVPTVGGGPGILEIPNVEIKTLMDDTGHKIYDYLWFPSTPDTGTQAADLEINLRGPLQDDSMILPFNGGHVPAEPPDHATEVTIKLRV